jgi:hypothetical protein
LVGCLSVWFLRVCQEEEQLLVEKMKRFSSRTQQQWGVPELIVSPMGWQSAVFELSGLEHNLTPSTQLLVLTRTVKAIYNEFKHVVLPQLAARGVGPTVIAADDLVPIFMYIFCLSNLKQPMRSRDLMWTLCHPDQLQGEGGYYLTVYESSIEFVLNEEITRESFSYSNSFGGGVGPGSASEGGPGSMSLSAASGWRGSGARRSSSGKGQGQGLGQGPGRSSLDAESLFGGGPRMSGSGRIISSPSQQQQPGSSSAVVRQSSRGSNSSSASGYADAQGGSSPFDLSNELHDPASGGAGSFNSNSSSSIGRGERGGGGSRFTMGSRTLSNNSVDSSGSRQSRGSTGFGSSLATSFAQHVTGLMNRKPAADNPTRESFS